MGEVGLFGGDLLGLGFSGDTIRAPLCDAAQGGSCIVIARLGPVLPHASMRAGASRGTCPSRTALPFHGLAALTAAGSGSKCRLLLCSLEIAWRSRCSRWRAPPRSDRFAVCSCCLGLCTRCFGDCAVLLSRPAHARLSGVWRT